MKKLLFISLALAIPQAFAAVRTPGLTPEQIKEQEQQAIINRMRKTDEERAQDIKGLTKEQQDKEIMDRMKKLDEERALKINALKEEALKLSGPILPLRAPLLTIIEKIKSLPEITILPVKEEPLQDETITIADIKGLIGALNAAASAVKVIGLPRLKARLLAIYQNPSIRELYKQLVKADEANALIEAPESGKGIFSTIVRKVNEHAYVNDFAKNLFSVLFEGKTLNDLIDLTIESLTLKINALKELQEAKGSETAAQKEYFEAEYNI